MSVILINGSAHQQGSTYTGLIEVVKALQENGIKTEIFQLGKKPIAGCCGCQQCAKTALCESYKNDKVNEIIKLIHKKQFDGFVFGTPVHYSAPSGFIKPFIDRLF